ncbi:MAG: hypothetical protein V8T36_10580 [Ruthenibacterium lactatiformans]
MKGFSRAEGVFHNARRKTNPTRLIVGSFLAVILCGTLLLMLPVSNRDGQMLDMLDAMFTATSATCVTGLVVFDTYTQFSTFGQSKNAAAHSGGRAGAGNAYHIFQHCRRASAGLQKPSPCQREHQPFGRQPLSCAAAVRYEGRLCFRGHRCWCCLLLCSSLSSVRMVFSSRC